MLNGRYTRNKTAREKLSNSNNIGVFDAVY